MQQRSRTGGAPTRLALLVRTQAPFTACVAVVTVATALIAPERLLHVQFLVGLALVAAAILLTLAVPWERLHPLWRLVLVDLNLTTVGLLLHVVGDVLNATYLLLSFPLLWLAFAFGRTGAVLALVGSVVVIWVPDAINGDVPTDARAVVELLTLTLLTVAVVSVVAAQAHRFKLSQLAVESAARDREEAVRDREQAVMEQERAGVILRTVADEVNVALAFLDEEHRVILDNRVSRELAHLAGFDPDTGALEHAYDADGFTPLPPERQPVVRVIGGETIRDVLYWVGPPGQQRATLNNGRPVIDEHGRYRGAVLVGHDVTELLEAVRSREASLATLSHELRTPLTAMIGHLELLEDSELPDGVRRPLRAMSRGAEQLQDLAERFLAASSTAPTPRPVSLSARDLVERAAEQLPDAPRVPLRVAVPTGTPVHADPVMLERVLVILLRNAVSYTTEGSIEVDAERREGGTTLIVRDTGMGVPADDLPRIFDRFHRGANVVRHEIRGTGLGLAVARGLVGAHGGTLTVASVEGVGTTVRASFPGPA
ncbi:sensor histidine kinase [Arenivirga flava]|uniref:histidine kinase n=1 Tax=Arenivirga flava TaxID=1930060 RepID=A0AA37UHR0_9MICO|nr:PAS domain-containing sensor histidine kinase [Arenivirga flava]GMA29153.1 two-component sensor histidine kinase [Arenivirga flava]